MHKLMRVTVNKYKSVSLNLELCQVYTASEVVADTVSAISVLTGSIGATRVIAKLLSYDVGPYRLI